MKSFFQRFHDSQPGTSKSRTKDTPYRQWIPSSKPDKDRTQLSNGVEPNTNASTKRHATKTAGLRSSDDAKADASGRVATDYSTRFSTFPGPSTNRHFPLNLPHSQTYPLDSSTSKTLNLSPPDDGNEKNTHSSKRNEAAELSNNDRDAVVRGESQRPSRSGQPSALSVPQQQQIWLPEIQMESKEKGKKKERRRQGDESDGGELRPPQPFDVPHRKSAKAKARDRGTTREMEGSNRQRVELKEKEQGTGGGNLDQVARYMVKEDQEWNQQEKDIRDLRERELREKERLKIRREREKAKEKEEDRERERLVLDRDRTGGGSRGKDKSKDKDKRKERDKDRGSDRMLRELWEKEQQQKLQRERDIGGRQPQWGKEQRETKEQREREGREEEERERELKEKRTKERLTERREKLDRERQEKEQRERERDQQEKWEREQDELERREIERLEKDRFKEDRRRRDQDLRQREPDVRDIDLLRLERERQEQRKRDRELWEQQRERERGERERRWRGDRIREVPQPIVSEAEANDKGLRSRKKDLKEGVSDFEMEQGRVQGLDKKRTSRMLAQASVPLKTEERKIQYTEAPRLPDYVVNTHSSTQHIIAGPDMPNSKSTTRDGVYVPEQKQQNQLQHSRDTSGRNIPARESSSIVAAPSTQSAQSPVPPLNPHGYAPSGSPGHVLSIERPGSTAPTGLTPHPVYYSVVRVPGPDGSNQVPPEVPPQLINKSIVSALQVQPPAQQSRSAPSSQAQAPYPSSTLSRPATSTRPAPRDHRSTELTTMNSSSMRAMEGSPQDIRTLPPPVATPSAPQNTPDLHPEAVSTKEARLTGRGVLVAPSLADTTTQNSRSKAPGPHGSSGQDTMALPLQTAQPMTSVHSVTLAPSTQQGHPSFASTKLPAASGLQYPINTLGVSSKDDTVFLSHPAKESPEYGSLRQGDSIPQIPPTQSRPSILYGPTTSKSVNTKKRSNAIPSQYESHADPAPPSDNVRTVHTSRPSPSYAPSKIQDDVPRTNETIIPPLGKLDSRSHVSPPADKAPLQESTPPTSRQHLGDKSNNQDSKPQQPVASALTAMESHAVTGDKDRNYGGMRPTPLVPVDNRGGTHSRHQRYPSEGDTMRRGGKPSPRSQPAESPQSSNPQISVEPNPKPTEYAEPEHDAKIAFRLPAVDSTISVNRRHNRPEPQLTTAVTPHDAGIRQAQHQPGQNGKGVPNLVSHFERMGEEARVGSTIIRPGTAIPRTDAMQPPVHEAPSQFRVVAPVIGHSHSVSYPQIDRPSTAIGIRPSVSSMSQSQSRHTQLDSSKMDRVNKSEFHSFPDKTPQQATSQPAIIETRYNHVPQRTANGQHITLRTIPEAQIALASSDYNEASSRMRAEVPTPPQKASSSERSVKEVPSKSMSGTVTTESSSGPLITRIAPSAAATQLVGKPHSHSSPQALEDKIPTRRYPTNQEGCGPVQLQSVQPIPPQLDGNPVVRRDNTGNSTRYSPEASSPSQPRKRKESSSRVHSEDKSSKVPGIKEASTEDTRASAHRISHAHGDPRVTAPVFDGRSTSHRTESMRGEIGQHPSPPLQRYTTETNIPSSMQHLSVDDRSRSNYAAGSYPPNTLHRPVLAPIDPASISPQRTGNSIHSKQEEEGLSRNQRNTVQVKDARLADLLSPPKANDIPHQSYLQDARRNLASKLEQQPNGSPNSTPGSTGANLETTPRFRSSSSRGEHSPRHAGGDNSPSGPSNPSPSYSQGPDLITKDYARTSPNVSQHTPSPRSRPMVAESQPQPGIQHRDEVSRHGTGAPASRQSPTRERQDHVPDMEDKYSRTHHQATPYTTYDTETRTSDTSRKPHIPSNSIPHQAWDQYAGKTTSQRDGQRRDTYDATQPIAITHSRTRSDSQNAQETSTSYSRHTFNMPHNIPSSQTQTLPHAPASGHVPPSVPTNQTLERPSDQVPYSRSQQSNQSQIPIPREEVSAPQQAIQAPPMKSTPSKKNYIQPLPPEIHNKGSSSVSQPPMPKPYEIWLPSTSSRDDHPPSRPAVAAPFHRDSGRDRDYARRTSTTSRVHRPSPPRDTRYLPYQSSTVDPRLTKPYHYLKTRKIRTMSLASVEAQDGAASTVIGSPTTSILSQVPINIPPEQDPMIAAREWTEAGAIVPGQRIRRPGLVWADPEDPPLVYQQEHRRPEPRSSRSRRPRSSGSRSREASDSDQPASS